MNLPYSYSDLTDLHKYLSERKINIRSIGSSALGLPIYRIKMKKHSYLLGLFKFRTLKQSVIILAR